MKWDEEENGMEEKRKEEGEGRIGDRRGERRGRGRGKGKE